MNLLLGSSCIALALITTTLIPPRDKDGERIKRLLDKPGATIGVLGEITTAGKSQLIARTAIGQDTLNSIWRYQAEVGNAVYKVVLVDIPWRGKSVRIGASTNPENRLHKVAVFDEFGKEITEFDPFLEQFRGDEGVSLTEGSNEDIGAVIKRRDTFVKATKPPVKPQDKKTWALLKHRQLMWGLGDAWRELDQAREKSEALEPKLKALDEQGAKIEQFSENMRAVLQPKSLGVYRELLKELRGNTAKAVELAGKGDAEGAANLVRARLKMDCGKCHGSDQNEWKKPLESALREEIVAAGFRKGAFVIDVDVRAVEHTQEEAQVLASAVKACLLAARD